MCRPVTGGGGQSTGMNETTLGGRICVPWPCGGRIWHPAGWRWQCLAVGGDGARWTDSSSIRPGDVDPAPDGRGTEAWLGVGWRRAPPPPLLAPRRCRASHAKAEPQTSQHLLAIATSRKTGSRNKRRGRGRKKGEEDGAPPSPPHATEPPPPEGAVSTAISREGEWVRKSVDKGERGYNISPTLVNSPLPHLWRALVTGPFEVS